MIVLSRSDWKAIFHAIDVQLMNAGAAEGRKWRKQLSAIRTKIGLDGQIAAQKGVASVTAQPGRERVTKFRVRIKDHHGWSLYDTAIETKDRAKEIAARARKLPDVTAVRVEKYNRFRTDTHGGR